MTLFKNDIEAAVEIDCGTGWMVLYPRQKTEITPGAESIRIRLREDCSIASEVYIHAEARLLSCEICTSDLGPFNLQADKWLERERMSVALAEAQALLRKVRHDGTKQKEAVKQGSVWVLRASAFALLYMMLALGLSMIALLVAPGLLMKGYVAFCSLSAVGMWTVVHRPLQPVVQKYGTRIIHLGFWSAFLSLLLGPYMLFILVRCHKNDDILECMMEGMDITDFIPLCLIPVGLVIHGLVRRFNPKMAVNFYPDLLEQQAVQQAIENSIVFHGRVLEGRGRGCVCSWPGKYASAWDAMVRSSKQGNTSAAVVFLPEGSELFGLHDPIPDEPDLRDLNGAWAFLEKSERVYLHVC